MPLPLPRPQLLRITLSHLSSPAALPPHATATAIPLLRPMRLRSTFTPTASSPSSAAATGITLPLTRTFSTTSTALSSDSHGGDGGGHGSHYDPPGQWLWGVSPEQRAKKEFKEDWENTFVYGYFGALLVGVVLWAYKPDTSIQTWALEEARRRLEAEGILEDPNPTGEKCGWDESWARRSVRK